VVKPLLCWLAVVALGLTAEVHLDLPEQIVPGAVLEATITVSDPADKIVGVDLPEVSGLTWQLSNRTSMSSGTDRSTVYAIGLLLRADRLGDLNVPPIPVHLADGSTLSSAPSVIQATSGDASLVGDAVASCRFDPPHIVPGQPTSLIYRLCLKRGDIAKLNIAPPEGSISLGERTRSDGRRVDTKGQAWAVVTFTWPITHATPGTYSVGGQQEYQIQVGDGIFDNRVRRKQIAVPPATLTVEAMPVEGRPDGFSGLIGPLSVTASLERERVAAGEGTVLSLTVHGRQTDLARRPALQLDGAQCYPKDDASNADGRTFRWDVVPATPGTITIPIVHVPYFDPGSRSYRSADSTALTLTVLPGRNRDLGIVGIAAPTDKPMPTPTRPVASMPAPQRGKAGRHPDLWMAPAALGSGLGLGLVVAVGRSLLRRRGPHRGRQLRAAGSDPTALLVALAALRPALHTPEQFAAADALQEAIDRHRFGGQIMPDPNGWVRALEDVA
jgi:hypothetical protein